MQLELWEHPLSPYAQKVKIALVEKGLAFTARVPDAMGSGSTPSTFRAMSPRGEVPVLVADGKAIFNSTIILEFIEDTQPKPTLLPADPFERARVRQIEEICDTHFEAITWELAEIAYFRRAEGAQAEAMQARAGEEIARLNAWLGVQLGQRQWLNGDAFGWGDLCAAPFVQGAAGFGFAPKGAMADWLARVRARESVATAFKQAADSIAAMSAVAGIVESGLFKRQYRDHRLEWMIRAGGMDIVRNGIERANIRFNEAP